MLSVIHKHPRDKAIRFYEKGHKYYISGKQQSPISVTTLIGGLFPKFDADKAVKSMMRGKKFNETHEMWGKTAEEIKECWSNAGKESCRLGTMLHNQIEDHYNGEYIDTDPELLVEWKQFNDFLQNNGVPEGSKPYRTEWCIYDESNMIAGSIDMVYENPDNTLSLYDWKRTKKIEKNSAFDYGITEAVEHLPSCNYWKYSLQLNIYKYILETKYGKTVKDLHLVVFFPTQKTYRKIKVPVMTETVEDILDEYKTKTQAENA